MKIFLAATSAKKFLSDVYEENPSKFLLESFYYFEEWQKDLIKNCEMFLLDSGAFTFMNSCKKEINWEEYIQKYIDFINKNNIKYFFELDIDVIVGYKEVLRLRKILEDGTGKKCIPVWHRSRGLEDFINLTKEYDYIAIGGIVTQEIKKEEYGVFIKLLEIARKNNCNVHGLGFTSVNSLHKYKFYSVDSTSWTSGSRFGQIHYFYNGQFILKSKKDKRLKNYIEGDKHNYLTWIKIQKYFLKNF